MRKARLKKRNRVLSFFFALFFPGLLIAASEQERQLFQFINSERARERRMPLVWDDELYDVALAHSKDMARQGKAAHRGSDGKEPHERIRAAGIYASKTGENIARDVNVVSAHTLLMQSVYHRDNILESGYSHSAVAVVKHNQFLYITELFIYKIHDYPLKEARQTLVRHFNQYRQENKLAPLIFSDSLSKAAQSHAETQEKFDSLTPMLALSPIARGSRNRTVVTMYTATTLLELPRQVRADLEKDSHRIGIGYKRIQGSICGGGCYLVVLVFS